MPSFIAPAPSRCPFPPLVELIKLSSRLHLLQLLFYFYSVPSGVEVPEDPIQPLQQKMPLLGGNRLIPAEMAAAKVAFLTRDEALDITGQVLVAEAGFTQMRLTEF